MNHELARRRSNYAMTNAARQPVHAVQFYETDRFLIESLAAYVGEGLAAGDAGVVIATAAHCAALESRLHDLGHDIAAAREDGRYIAVDAAEMLSQVMVDGEPSPPRFIEAVSGTIIRARGERRPRHVRVFGEMVSLLWADGQQDEAMAIESLWNDLARSMVFALVCGYWVGLFPDADRPSAALLNIAAAHRQNTALDG